MTIITDTKLPISRGKCPMCGSAIRYNGTSGTAEKPWKCTGCGGYGIENQGDEGPVHHSLTNAHGVSIVLLEP